MGIDRVICPLIKAINKAPYIAQKVDLNALKSLKLMDFGVGDVLQTSFSIDRINKSICEVMKIGEGTQAKVYKIIDTNYVIRLPLNKNILDASAKINFNISAQDRINHCIATIGDCQVQKYIAGFNPRGYIEHSFRSGLRLEHNIEKNNQIKKCIVEKLSIDKMKKYYLQLVEAHRTGMRHDYFGENAILNLNTGDLTAIDFVQGTRKNFFNSLMSQFNGYVGLNSVEQKQILNKALRSLFELIEEGKILPSEIELCSSKLNNINYFPKIQDEKYFDFIKNIIDSFNKDKSVENVRYILNQLK